MGQGARKVSRRRPTGKVGRPHEAEARAIIDLKALKRDAFHIVDLGGVPHAIRWTSNDVIEFYEVVES